MIKVFSHPLIYPSTRLPDFRFQLDPGVFAVAICCAQGARLDIVSFLHSYSVTPVVLFCHSRESGNDNLRRGRCTFRCGFFGVLLSAICHLLFAAPKAHGLTLPILARRISNPHMNPGCPAALLFASADCISPRALLCRAPRFSAFRHPLQQKNLKRSC
jgi:hypothetical protein